MTRTIHAVVLASVLILSVLAFSETVGTSYASNAFSDRDVKPKQLKFDHDESHEKKNVCPSQSFLAEPHSKGAKQILDISYIAQNDEDSGIGGYWALDHFKEHLKVWQLANGTFYALKSYDGIFVTPAGGLDPGTGTHLQNESSFGEITGGYVSTMVGTFTPGANPTNGNIGTFNYGGTMTDILHNTYGSQTGAPDAYDWTSAYFSNTGNFNEIHWGWSYKLDPEFQSSTSANQWCNYNVADGGNSGNIRS
ncbi:exported protein of unknown function [Nitrosotalea devaniterrae]|uniref:Uncharacterized protein n=1 Tax=Nitrosotalea devaniterrae TaxID=1078905 RepID=A0A128A3A5_9ARCH|nr:exported protein of unknown function [Candidatus Nitrosotalea devanaterra]